MSIETDSSLTVLSTSAGLTNPGMFQTVEWKCLKSARALLQATTGQLKRTPPGGEQRTHPSLGDFQNLDDTRAALEPAHVKEAHSRQGALTPGERTFQVDVRPRLKDGSSWAVLTFSKRAFCQSRNIIMYVLSRAPNDVKKC